MPCDHKVSWAPLLRERTGEASRALAGSVSYQAQYRWDGLPPQPLTLSLWRPTNRAP